MRTVFFGVADLPDAETGPDEFLLVGRHHLTQDIAQGKPAVKASGVVALHKFTHRFFMHDAQIKRLGILPALLHRDIDVIHAIERPINGDEVPTRRAFFRGGSRGLHAIII